MRKGDKRRTIGLHFQAAQAIAEYIDKAGLSSGPRGTRAADLPNGHRGNAFRRPEWNGARHQNQHPHTVSAGEMVAAFASENHLATIVGTETAGRLIPGPDFRSATATCWSCEAQYITWHGHRFEGSGIKADLKVPWSPEQFAAGGDNQIESALKLLTSRWWSSRQIRTSGQCGGTDSHGDL
jgi:hypothetical protein